MDFLRSIMQFVESHPALFSGLAGIAAVIGAIGGMALQYFRNKKELDQRLDEIRNSHVREKQLAAKNGNLEASLNHEVQESAKLQGEIGQLKEECVVEKIQHEVDVHYQKEERAKREAVFKAAYKKREDELLAQIKADRDELVKHEKQQKRWENVLRRTLKAEGEFYAAKIRCGTPRFRPPPRKSRPSAIASSPYRRNIRSATTASPSFSRR